MSSQFRTDGKALPGYTMTTIRAPENRPHRPPVKADKFSLFCKNEPGKTNVFALSLGLGAVSHSIAITS